MESTGPAYLEIVDFIASGTTPETVATYRPSRGAQDRVADLIKRERDGELTPDEKSELDHFVELEHILRMAKDGRCRSFLVAEVLNAATRKQVVSRASGRCEYCLISDDCVGFSHEVDHIVSRKHGGPTELDNLAYIAA